MTHNTIGQNIKFLRRKQKLSQEMLAEGLEMKRGNIASYESGKAKPSAENLLRMANFFDVSISDMIQKDLSAEDESAFPDIRTEVQGIEQTIAYNARVRIILEGLKEYHKLRLKKHEELPSAFHHLIYDFDRLLDLLEETIIRNDLVLTKLSS